MAKIDGKAPVKLTAGVKAAMASGIPLHKAIASQPNSQPPVKGVKANG